ncbi:MAG: response regulator transcription factor [Ignavibacteriales bacterium]|nr:response regulator transcription factor [Ignavibacteriales bacterium]
MRAILVDDEELARTVVREHCAHHPEIDILAECSNGFEAVKAISELKPDLVFLDIQMPKLNGFEVLELSDHTLAVIFVTAFDQFALKAFEVHAVDYLLKPFSKERFESALTRARDRISRQPSAGVNGLLEEIRRNNRPLERILIKEGPNVRVIPVENVDYIEAQDDYAAIHTGGKSYLKQQRIAEFEQLLDAARFARIHRSYILNIDCLSKIEAYAKNSKMAVLKDGTQLPVSRTGYEKLKGML